MVAISSNYVTSLEASGQGRNWKGPGKMLYEEKNSRIVACRARPEPATVDVVHIILDSFFLVTWEHAGEGKEK